MQTLVNPQLYCNSLTQYSRLLTRTVQAGDLGIGGDNPVRLQSMTTTDTMDTPATVEQSIRMIAAGCELVRITAPSLNEAKNLEQIRNELHRRGYRVPICADIHFTPNAAEAAARLVEKVRVNPGNYADRKKFEHVEYSDASYDSELQRIRERFLPLVKICKEYGTAMRIGTNHGSLSDRIMSRYGDTPLGMVESALEFLSICEDENYYNVVLSMKASNPQVMVHAYRLLVSRMKERQENPSDPVYPLHLGVTEAGEGEDGRIKSAVGIGTLLEDGIGDTIRVSLTEDPEFEIPVARLLAARTAERAASQRPIAPVQEDVAAIHGQQSFSPYAYEKRISAPCLNIGGKNVPRIVLDLSAAQTILPSSLRSAGYQYDAASDKWNLSEQACDFIFAGNNSIDFEIPGTLGIIEPAARWLIGTAKARHYPYFSFNEFVRAKEKSGELNFVSVSIQDLMQENFSELDLTHVVLVFETTNPHGMAELRRMFIELGRKNCAVPVVIKCTYSISDPQKLQIDASVDCGALLLDGFGDGLWLAGKTATAARLKDINSTCFGILQATRTRISKTEYISCPSCGRTLFDLQETTARIRSRTDHLKGVKIGIMGCIVNGPGEMADADYGYVGTGPGKITLYKGKDVVQRNIDSEKAVDALIDLIKANGDWVEQKSPVS